MIQKGKTGKRNTTDQDHIVNIKSTNVRAPGRNTKKIKNMLMIFKHLQISPAKVLFDYAPRFCY